MKDPAFLFYSQDFLVGTMAMSFEDRGKYITILSYMHQNGKINEKTISFLVGSISDILRLKFKVDKNGLWYNERLEIEREKRKKFIESRVNNGMKGGRPKKNKKPNGKPNGKPTGNLIENEDENEIDYKNIMEKYNLYCKNLTKLIKLSDSRKKHINARINDFSSDEIINVFDKVSKSNFLNGDNERRWKADFDWIIKPTNFIKILEGKYDNKNTKPRMI